MHQLPERPRIPERFSVMPAADDEFRLHSLTFSISVSSPAPGLLTHLLPLLDGRHSMQELIDDLDGFDEEQVYATLERLLQVGVLEDAALAPQDALTPEESERYHDQLVFLSHFAIPPDSKTAAAADIPTSPEEYQLKLKQAKVAVFGLGRLGSQLIRALALAGVGEIVGVDDGTVTAADARTDAWFDAQHIGLKRAGVLQDLVAGTNPNVTFSAVSDPVGATAERVPLLSGMSFAVLSADDFNPTEYDAINCACLETETPWTSCRLFGFEFNIGPTVIPHKTPCYKCFDLRQKSNLTDYAEYLIVEGYLKKHPLRSGALAITPGIGLTALEVIKALTHFAEPATYAHLCSLNLLNLEIKLHPILKIPRCPHCGRPSHGRPTIQIWEQDKAEA